MQNVQRASAYAAATVAAAVIWPSSRASAQTPTFDDLPYAQVALDNGGVATLRMDVWRSTAEIEHAPVVVWIHGGGWQSGTYNNPPPGLAPLLEAGFAVASVQYRLSGAAIFPAQIHDVKGAVRFLRAHADEYGLDPSRLAAWGGSAGGHLTSLLATSGGVAELEGTTGGNSEFSSRLQAAVDYFGPMDILQMNLDVATPPGSTLNHDAATSPESRLIGFDGPGEGIGVLRNNLENPAPPFPQKAALAMLVNPITHLTDDDPPMFIAHGDLDTTVPMKQSQRLADALAEREIEHVMRVVEGAGHGFGMQSGAVSAEAIAFLLAQLAQPTGDYDRDGDVDGNDLLTWQRELGATADPAGSGADGDVDGEVGATDLETWRLHFGETPGAAVAGGVAVPEPGLAAMGAATWIVAAAGYAGMRREESSRRSKR
jgi:acetyl esterase/lipase